MKFSAILMISIVIISAFPMFVPKASAAVTKKWTVIAYLGGDNSLQDSVVDFLDKMQLAGATDDVNILAVVDYSSKPDVVLKILPHYDLGSPYPFNKVDITSDITTLGEFDMGDPAFAKSFLEYVKANYPADHYFMTILNHGDGLACPSEDDHKEGGGQGFPLTIEELAGAIPHGMFIDVLYMYACYMGNIETAIELKDKVSFLVASEDRAASGGFWILTDAGPIDAVLSRLNANPSESAGVLAKDIVDSYYDWASWHPTISPVFTMAAYDMNHVSDLADSVDAFSKRLETLDAEQLTEISQAIANCVRMHDENDVYTKIWTDLLDFTEQVSIAIADPALVNDGLQVALAHANVVVDFKYGSDRQYCYGMGIFLPKTVDVLESYFPVWISNKYMDSIFGKTNAWTDFVVRHYANVAIEKGLTWLRGQQTTSHWCPVGVTSLALMGYLNSNTALDDPTVTQDLDYLVLQRNPDGSFGSDKTYETSLAIMALIDARTAGYNPTSPDVDNYVRNGLDWLLSNQNIEANTAITPSNYYYGGWGYNGASSSWADLSNTQFALIAVSLAESYLKEAVHTINWQAASTFIARCNNNATNNPNYLKDDGGFIYQPQSTTRTSTGDSYGSMTAAGVWTLSLAHMAGISQINIQTKTIDLMDPIHSGLSWLQKYYSVYGNPVGYSWGGDSFKYYYLWTVSKAWEICNLPSVRGHYWYPELVSSLVDTLSQTQDGSWSGTGSEEDTVLATEWAILSMQLPIVSQSKLEKSKLEVTLHSGADLHLYDQLNRHVGFDYVTQQDEIQIPGATYNGHNAEPQIITVPLTESLKFTLTVVGTTGGPYELTIDINTDGALIAERDFTGTTFHGGSLSYDTEVVTIAGLSLLVQQQVPEDNTPPTTYLQIGEPKYVDSSHNTYVASATPLTLIATDNPGGSGVASTSYRIYNNTYSKGWLGYSAAFNLTGLKDGTYSIDYNSTDGVGNTEPTNTATVILDNTPPTTAPTIGDPKYVSGRTYVTPDTPFTLTATDAGSGVKSTAYRITSSSGYESGWQIYAKAFNLTSLRDGNYTIAFNSTDNVGNVETTHRINVTLFSWNFVFEDDCGRGTILKINMMYKFFEFIAPGKDYGVRRATCMQSWNNYQVIGINHRDSQLILSTYAVDTKIDYCWAMAWDLQTGKCYALLDKPGIEK